MKRDPAFRPSVTILENRWLPTAAAYPDVIRTVVQQWYVSQADQKSNPVVFLGDSITLFWGTATRPAPGSASFLKDFAPLGAANFGIVGDTSQNLLYRVENGDMNGQPKVVVVMIGINDLLAGSTPKQAASGVTSVVHAIQTESPNTKILLLGVLPSEITVLNPAVRQLNTLIARLGRQPGVTYLNPGTQFEGANGIAKPSLMMDLVHPDAAGYQVLANAIDGTILHLLQGGTPTTAPSPSGRASTSSNKASKVQAEAISEPSAPDNEIVPLVTSLDVPMVDTTTTTTVRIKSFATELVNVAAT